MKEFKGKVAVITGAASGIGRAIAERCAQEGMKVAVADIERQALEKAELELRAAGASVLAVPTDVSKAEEVEALKDKTLAAFGAVHLLCNNAGVGAGSTVWESTLADWEWVIGVNLWGMIHGARTFVPVMLAQNSEGHIVNTASIAGLLPSHPSATYQVTKHAVVGLTEHLYNSLKQMQSKIHVSVLCPGWVKTRIMDSERNRPAALQNKEEAVMSPMVEAVYQYMLNAVETGTDPAKVAEMVFKGIRAEQLYIPTSLEVNRELQERMETILKQMTSLPQ